MMIMWKSGQIISVFCLVTLFTVGCVAKVIKYDKRIVSGNTARGGQFPWHVSIIGKYPAGSSLLCGGSLITHEWVLTAAHCVLGMASIKLGLGSTELMEPQISYENVTEYFIHPQYNRPNKHHDIALIRLPERITETERIRVIELPKTTSNVTYDLELGFVCGYGRYIDDSQVVSRNLRWTRVKIIQNTECQRIYGGRVVIDSTLCAVSIHTAGQNTCNGDSGGSLVVKEGDHYRQIGVISFAAADQCGAGLPSGFMRIRSHLHWIYSVMINYDDHANHPQGGYTLPRHQKQQMDDSKYAADYYDNDYYGNNDDDNHNGDFFM